MLDRTTHIPERMGEDHLPTLPLDGLILVTTALSPPPARDTCSDIPSQAFGPEWYSDNYGYYEIPTDSPEGMNWQPQQTHEYHYTTCIAKWYPFPYIPYSRVGPIRSSEPAPDMSLNIASEVMKLLRDKANLRRYGRLFLDRNFQEFMMSIVNQWRSVDGLSHVWGIDGGWCDKWCSLLDTNEPSPIFIPKEDASHAKSNISSAHKTGKVDKMGGKTSDHTRILMIDLSTRNIRAGRPGSMKHLDFGSRWKSSALISIVIRNSQEISVHCAGEYDAEMPHVETLAAEDLHESTGSNDAEWDGTRDANPFDIFESRAPSPLCISV